MQNFAMDLRLSRTDTGLDGFSKRLYSSEGLIEKSRSLGLGATKIVLGYCQKSGNGTLGNFVESITQNQWLIALEKVLVSTPNVLTIKLMELDNQHPLSSSSCSLTKAVSAPSEQNAKAKMTKCGKTNSKRRKKEELQDDMLLWERLKARQPVTRSERQDERLRQWKEQVASEYDGCEALNERQIKCSCGKVFAINKMNAIKAVGKLHYTACVSRKEKNIADAKSKGQKCVTDFFQ